MATWGHGEVGSQPKLPLGTMSVSVAMQWQGLVLMVHLTAREHGMSQPLGTTWIPRDYAELVLLPLSRCSTLESWSHLSLLAGLQRIGLEPCPSSKAELVLMVGMWVNRPECVSVGKLTQPLIC